jgi:2-phosphoglycolate phosphatase
MSTAGPTRIRAVLFDLDGTLIESAPDLAGAANDLRQQRGLPPMPLSELRPWVGAGARGMVGAAFKLQPGHAEFDALRDAFLQRYEERMTQLTHVFDEIRPLLEHLQSRPMPWGIVTNKHTRFARPIVQALGLHEQAATLICGDTTPHAKPHPAPLLEAAQQIGVPPEACLYVGDDLRDMHAGLAAGMLTAAAGWGYLGVGESIEAWGADFIAQTPDDLLKWLELA